MAGKKANEKFGELLLEYDAQPKMIALIMQAEKLGEEIQKERTDSEITLNQS